MNIVNSVRSGGLVGSGCTLKTSFRPRTPLGLESCKLPGEPPRSARHNAKWLPAARRALLPAGGGPERQRRHGGFNLDDLAVLDLEHLWDEGVEGAARRTGVLHVAIT